MRYSLWGHKESDTTSHTAQYLTRELWEEEIESQCRLERATKYISLARPRGDVLGKPLTWRKRGLKEVEGRRWGGRQSRWAPRAPAIGQ